MWGAVRVPETRYDGPSVRCRHRRHYHALQGRWSKQRERLCNYVEGHRFEVFYGWNPRCCNKGTYLKPGTKYRPGSLSYHL
jgi:hypothetical protein